MKKRYLKALGILSFLIGAVFILNSFQGITGFVVLEDVGRQASSFLGLAFVVGGILLLMSSREKSGLEERAHSSSEFDKLKRDLKRRERYGENQFIEGGIVSQILRSDLNRIKKVPENVWNDYNPNLSFEENRARVMEAFHEDNPDSGLEINDEIREGYLKVIGVNRDEFYGKGKPPLEMRRTWLENKKKYLETKEFKKFKHQAIKEIQRLDKAALSGELVPFLEQPPVQSFAYPGFKSKVIYFGPKELAERYKYERSQVEALEAEHFGKDVFKYHVIYDPDDLEKGKIPHGHWELDYIRRK